MDEPQYYNQQNCLNIFFNIIGQILGEKNFLFLVRHFEKISRFSTYYRFID